MTFPIPTMIAVRIIIYSNIIESVRFNLSFLSKNLTTGLKIKNRKPEIKIGKNSVVKKIPTGSSKNETLDAIKIIVNMIRTWSDHF